MFIENDVIRIRHSAQVYNIGNDVIHIWHTLLAQKVYNIENDVIHYWHNKCITSKTMLYIIATKSV